jgi:hypothetical protein
MAHVGGFLVGALAQLADDRRLRPPTVGATTDRGGSEMTDLITEPIDIEALLAEIARYLAAVEAFRAEGCTPCWR